MRYVLTTLLTLALAGPAAASDRLRTFSSEFPAAGVRAVEVAAGVGTVEIQAHPGGAIATDVDVVAKRFSGRGDRRTRRLVEDLALSEELKGDVLVLRLLPEQRGRTEFNEEWVVKLPASLGITVKLGVGEIRVVDVSGDVELKLGVGDVTVEGEFSAFGPIRASCGVGDVAVRTPAGRERGSGFIAKDLAAQGEGTSTLRAAVGVGDISVRLR